jgi:glycosyltransferase involved in cell wall biosynthesis
MKIAVYYPNVFPAYSIKDDTDMVIQYLEKKGVNIIKFSSVNDIPKNADLIWDSLTGGGNITIFDKKFDKPTVITMHGSALFSLPLKDNIVKYKTILRLLQKRLIYKNQWKKKSKFVDKVIAVSNYCENETIEYLPFKKEQITTIYHGIDFSFFKVENNKENQKLKTFLHISQFQPKKNIGRIIEAFKIANNKIPDIKLKIICPGYPYKNSLKNIEIINTYVDRKEIIELYHNSYAFIFPSLHETFGKPILEAMASGIPVITSNTTACKEIGGNDAILVNPYNIYDISEAIIKISQDEELYKELVLRGLKKAKILTWEKSAEEHYKLFKLIIK